MLTGAACVFLLVSSLAGRLHAHVRVCACVCMRPPSLTQVRAEHRAENDLFRAILLGHNTNNTPAAGAQQQNTSAAAGGHKALFMQHKQG